jgi:hypothetical protein
MPSARRGNRALDGVEALLVGWAPGEEGGTAFVRLLSGAVSPSGRLSQVRKAPSRPISWANFSLS